MEHVSGGIKSIPRDSVVYNFGILPIGSDKYCLQIWIFNVLPG